MQAFSSHHPRIFLASSSHFNISDTWNTPAQNSPLNKPLHHQIGDRDIW